MSMHFKPAKESEDQKRSRRLGDRTNRVVIVGTIIVVVLALGQCFR